MYYKNQFELTNTLLKTRIPELDMWEKSVLVHLTTYFSKGKDGLFTGFPSYKTLAKCSGMGETKLKQCINKLQDLGIITFVRQFNSSKVYTWRGLSEIERTFYSVPKIKRTPAEWAAWRKNGLKIEALKLQLDEIEKNRFVVEDKKCIPSSI